jgi:uncharacterized glyoxalase superfamily protein PhnB
VKRARTRLGNRLLQVHSPGGNTDIFIKSDDKTRTYEELKAVGVEFSTDLTKESWGTYEIFKDPNGNELWM